MCQVQLNLIKPLLLKLPDSQLVCLIEVSFLSPLSELVQTLQSFVYVINSVFISLICHAAKVKGMKVMCLPTGGQLSWGTLSNAGPPGRSLQDKGKLFTSSKVA